MSFFPFKKIFTGSFLHSLHSLNNTEAKESWVWIVNFFSFFRVVKLLIKPGCFFFFLNCSFRLYLNQGNFLIIFKIVHAKIVQHPRIPVSVGVVDMHSLSLSL